MENSAVEKIKKKIKGIKIEYVIAVFAIIAVVAIFLSSYLKSDSGQTSSSDVENYVSMLEKKMSDELSKIEGAGKVSVIISVKSGVNTVIATQKKENSAGVTEETPVLVGGKPVVLGEVYPEICGVIIVAKGAGNLKVKMALIAAARVFLDVDKDKIEIMTMG